MTPTRIAGSSWRRAESLRLSRRPRLHCFYPLRCTVQRLRRRTPPAPSAEAQVFAVLVVFARAVAAGAGARVRKTLHQAVERGRLIGRPFSCSCRNKLLRLEPALDEPADGL